MSEQQELDDAVWLAGGETRLNLGKNLLDSARIEGQSEPSESYVPILLRLAFPPSLPQEQRFVMIFTAYFDESGTNPGDDSLTIAGYVSTPDAWEKFAVEWKEKVDTFGISAWHQTDWSQSVREFAGWDAHQPVRQARLAEMLAIIHKYALASISISIPRALYDDVFSSEANDFVGGPYGLAANMMFLQLAQKLDDIGVYGQIAYFFEAGAVGIGQIQRVFNENYQDPVQRERLRLISLTFVGKLDFTPLQASDILAYETFKEMPKVLGLDARRRRIPLELLTAIPNDWARVERDEIEKWHRAIVVRLGLRPDQLWTERPQPHRETPMVAISATQFQGRWNWWHQFHARTLRRRSQ